MKKTFLKHISTVLALILLIGASASLITGCKPKGGTGLSNEETPLVLSSEALDGVFNPFFYSAGADGEIVGYTQVSMLSGNENGEIIANWQEPCVSFAYSVVTTGSRSDYESSGNYNNYYTDYYFAIKDGLKFSDGTALTMHDVLFNMYMVLDPAYTGISTMYSVNIKGLQAYREQTENENEQGSDYYSNLADARIQAILGWAENNKENDWGQFGSYEASATPHIANDINKIYELFREEMETDWAASRDTAANEEYDRYVDKNGNRIYTEDWQVFLAMYGHFRADRKLDANDKEYFELYTDYPAGKAHDKDTVIQYCFDAMFADYETAPKSYKENLKSALTMYQTGDKMRTYLRAEIMRDELGGELRVKNVSGITVMPNASSIPDANGGEIKLKDANGAEKSYDVLKIRIDGEDPKAIQNLSFVVAPGHYYSTPELWSAALADTNYTSNFGVSWSDPTFMTRIQQNQLPLGAGPYLAANENNEIAKSKSEFFSSDNIVYMIRNDNFMLGSPKIRKLRFKVVSTAQLYNEVKSGGVHFASPQAKKTTVESLTGTDKDVLNYALADNLGYGYVGINAGEVKNIWVRRAIMTALNPNLTVDYYGGSDYASVITRPMSKTLKSYYPNADTYVYKQGLNSYSYAYDATGETALRYARDMGGCTVSNGKLVDTDGKALKYTFTVAGDTEDHPAFNMLTNAAKILNDKGFDITVTKDSSALIKLANGKLTVWAAAWSSSSDPDMFQVYHKNSMATSIKAWGYGYLTGNESGDQREIVNRLADYIDAGRESTVVEVRQRVYADALDTLMELAVECPTYQRKSLYVWPRNVFDESTIYTGTGVSAYRSPLSEIWNVSFKED